MPGPHFAQVGKASSTAQRDIAPLQAQQAAVPGKATQVEQSYRTGDAAIDTSGMGNRAGAFLSQGQRHMLVERLTGRVGAAYTSYCTAITNIEIAELVEKEEELPLWATLLMTAGGKLMEAGLGIIAESLKAEKAVVSKLAEAGVTGVKEKEAEEKILGLSAKSVEAIIAQATDTTKEKSKPAVAKVAGGGAREDAKSKKLNYARYLGDAAIMMFQNVREKPPGIATDAELIAIVESFRGDRHTIGAYQEALEAQIKRYMASHVKDIGRAEGKSEAPDRTYNAKFRLENRVAWLVTGGGRQLIYVDRAFATRDDILPNEDPDGKYDTPSSAYTSPEHALSLRDEGTWTEPTPDKEHAKTVKRKEPQVGYEKMLGVVEPEFVELALQAQEQKWQAEPETFRYDYRTAPPTLIKVSK